MPHPPRSVMFCVFDCEISNILPGLLQKSEGRHLYFTEIGHFSFALTLMSNQKLSYQDIT